MGGKKVMTNKGWLLLFGLFVLSSPAFGQGGEEQPQGPPPAPVEVAPAVKKTVAGQITLIGTTEAAARSLVAAEVSGLVEKFPAQEGDFVEKGKLLAQLRSTNVRLRLQAAIAAREKVKANLSFSETELERYRKLKDSESIAGRKYDETFYQNKSLRQQLLETEAQIEILKDDLQKKTVEAPFSGFVAKEHTQVGEWLPVGGAVVTLVDMAQIKITVDVPERYTVQLNSQDDVRILVGNISNEPLPGKISAILPEGDPNARTFPVRVRLTNLDLKIKGGMEARVTFNLGTEKDALLVPKDAIVTAGTNRLVFVVANQVVQPVMVQVLGYHDGSVAIEGPVKPGDLVVIRGNERLRPGQPVKILNE
jgi:RND family efflux transporter MFP subunit